MGFKNSLLLSLLFLNFAKAQDPIPELPSLFSLEEVSGRTLPASAFHHTCELTRKGRIKLHKSTGRLSSGEWSKVIHKNKKLNPKTVRLFQSLIAKTGETDLVKQQASCDIGSASIAVAQGNAIRLLYNRVDCGEISLNPSEEMKALLKLINQYCEIQFFL